MTLKMTFSTPKIFGLLASNSAVKYLQHQTFYFILLLIKLLFLFLFLQAATVTATLEKSNRVKAVVVEIAADQALVATGGYPVLKVHSFILTIGSFAKALVSRGFTVQID